MKYRNVSITDYPSIIEYTRATETAKVRGAKTKMRENKRKHPLSLFDLSSVRSYASEEGEKLSRCSAPRCKYDNTAAILLHQ